MRTGFTELLDIEAPIVLAPMGGAVTPELAAAVSNAGGLGMLPLSWNTLDEARNHVAETVAPNAPHRALRNSTVEAWKEAGRPVNDAERILAEPA